MSLQSVYVDCREMGEGHILFWEMINVPVLLMHLWYNKNLLTFYGSNFPLLICCVNSWLFVLILSPLRSIITQHMFHTIPWGRCLWLHHCLVIMNIKKELETTNSLWVFLFLKFIVKEENTRNLALKTEISNFLFVRRNTNCHQNIRLRSHFS